MPGPSGNLPVVRQWAAFAFAGLAAFSGVLTYLAMTGAVPFIPPTVQNVIVLLVIDLVLLVLLATVVGYRVVALWRERRRRRGGSQLHVRLAVLFTAVALVPTVLVALFTVLFFHYGLQGWFSQRVQTALDRSLAVAEAYLEEHRRVLVADALAMANDLGRSGPRLFANTRDLEKVLEAHANARSLSDAQIVEAGRRVLARSMFSFAADFSPVPEWALEAARRGEVAIVGDREGDRLGALLRIAGLDDTFRELLKARRRRPADDLISELAASPGLSDDDLVANCILLLFAGHETTTGLLANGLMRLIHHPGQQALLRREPERMEAAVEEMLRFDSPAPAVSRIAVDDLEIRGTHIRAGERVFLMLNAANRDPEAFEDPERFDIAPRNGRQIAFGFGIHFCVGAPLARLEAALAFPRLLAAMEDIEIAADRLDWRDGVSLRGTVSMPIRFRATPAA